MFNSKLVNNNAIYPLEEEGCGTTFQIPAGHVSHIKLVMASLTSESLLFSVREWGQGILSLKLNFIQGLKIFLCSTFAT